MAIDQGTAILVAVLTWLAASRGTFVTTFFAAIFWLFLTFEIFNNGTQLQSDFLGVGSLGLSITLFWLAGTSMWSHRGSGKGPWL